MSNSKLDATFHGETPEEQRERIIRANLGTPGIVSDYDDALALGYQPESWDGMWKLPARRSIVGRPILWLTRRWALVWEVEYIPGTHHLPRRTRRGRTVTRWRLRRAQDT